MDSRGGGVLNPNNPPLYTPLGIGSLFGLGHTPFSPVMYEESYNEQNLNVVFLKLSVLVTGTFFSNNIPPFTQILNQELKFITRMFV